MDYDVGEAFRKIENELIASMIRNMERHKVEEITEGKQWGMWQAEQLRSLELYRRENQKKFSGEFADINAKIEEMIRYNKNAGMMEQENAILRAIKNGYKPKTAKGISGQFFQLNERKLEALIEETKKNMQNAETAILRMSNDRYRKVIFNAQVYANTGAGTYEQAVDMATKDYLSSGINCIEYKNGARVNVAAYAEMALRTANTRAYLQGEGQKRQEWGITTVIMNKRGTACHKCFRFAGKVFIDDVWSGGTSKDGPYPLLSSAIAQGLYHPNCRDIHTTYFPGISEPPTELTEQEKTKSRQEYEREQKKRHAQHEADRFGRLARYSLYEENKRRYRYKRNIYHKIIDMIDTIREHKPIKIYELDKLYRKDLFDIIDSSDIRIQKFVIRHCDDILFINENAIGRGVTKKKGIRVNSSVDKKNVRGAYTTTFHEMGHCIDRSIGLSYKSTAFKESLEKDFDNLVKSYCNVYNINIDTAYQEISIKLKEHKYHSISDICGGLTYNKCVGRYMHKKEYWKKAYALEKEAFAHFFEAYARNDIEKISAIRQVFPLAEKEFIRLLEE